MTKKIILILTLAMTVSTLSLLSGCRSKGEAEEGIFVPASEEYIILDEGQKNDSGNSGKKPGESNTNAKKASDKDKKDASSSEEQSGTKKDEPASSTKPSSGSSSSGSPAVGEDETPFVPATESDPGSKTNTSKSGEGIVSSIE